jgi:hypothetical protein
MTLPDPDLRELANHRMIPRRCTCTWQWHTSSNPWRWLLTQISPSCAVHNPVDEDAVAIIEDIFPGKGPVKAGG